MSPLTTLRRHVLEHPEDLAAHLVLADALSEQGDAWGDYIGARVRGEPAALTEALKTRLLGRLEEHLSWWDVRCGFLRTARLAPMTVRAFRQLAGLSEWQGITRLGLPARLQPSPTGVFAMPVDAVRTLLTHPSCAQVQEVEGLGFGAFLELCELDRRYERVELSQLPKWGLHAPLHQGALAVGELVLRGSDVTLASAVAWLKTWGRAVFDRIERFRVEGPRAAGVEWLTGRAGTAARQLIGPDWSAAREAGGWHVELRGVVPPSGMEGLAALAMLPGLCAAMSRLAPAATRFTMHLPDLDEGSLRQLREAAAGRPVEFRALGPRGDLSLEEVF